MSLSGAAQSSLRLAVVLSHPIQYYAPWFRHLANHTSLRLQVFYLSDHGAVARRDAKFGATFAWDTDLLSGYPHTFIPNLARQPDVTTFAGLHNPGLFPAIRAFAPDAILLFGYAHRTHLRLILGAPAPLVFRGDSHLLGHSRLPWRKRRLLGWLFRRFAAITYVGAANRDYFRAFGVPDSKLFFAPHAVDQHHFVPTVERCTHAQNLRAELGLADRFVILFAGKLVPEKQPVELLHAFLSLPPDRVALVFNGDGAERPQLERIAAAHPEHIVRFLPFANQSQMPGRYLLADLFVLPSRGHYETWGLAVNEAMHLGVPCLVSDRVGCQRDLITDGETGWVFSVDQPEGLPDALRRAFAQTAADREVMKAAIAERIRRYTYDQATTGLLLALRHISP